MMSPFEQDPNASYNLIHMPEDGTPEWHEIRRKSGVTASESPAVMGLSKWETAHGIYLLKRGLIKPAESTPQMEWGTDVEPIIRKRFEKETGLVGTKPDFMFQSKVCPWICANPDWVSIKGDECGAEFKMSDSAKDWGESQSQDCPVHYYMQVQHQLIATGLPIIYLYVRLPYSDFRMYPITPDAEIQERIIEETRKFWFDHVLAGIEPVATDPESVRKQFPSIKDEAVELGDEALKLVKCHAKYKEAIEELEVKRKGCEARIFQLTGENKRATIPGWAGSVTRSLSPDKEVPEEVIPAHVRKGRLTTRINHPRS